jgi:hypothetical protein
VLPRQAAGGGHTKWLIQQVARQVVWEAGCRAAGCRTWRLQPQPTTLGSRA